MLELALALAVLQSPQDAGAPLELLYFYTPDCPPCKPSTEALIPRLREKYGARLRIEMLDVREEAALLRLLEAERALRAPPSAGLPKAVLDGRIYLSGEAALFQHIELHIERRLRSPASERPAPPAPADRAALLRERFALYNAGMVAVAGLVDGINPCATATLVFLLSFLAFCRRTRREIALVGAVYTATVFATYFLAGLGILAALGSIPRASVLVDGTRWAALIATVALAALSFHDAAVYWRTGRGRDAVLQLPQTLKRRIHDAIRSNLRTGSLLAGSAAAGFLVTLIEGACTGQVYLPVLAGMVGEEPARAVGYLLLYNLMFVAPLLLVFGAYLGGVSSERLAGFFRRRAAAAKALLGVFFLAVGAWLLRALI